MRTPLLLSFVLGAALLPAQEREFGKPVATTLTEMRAEPEAYRNVKVVFTIQFASLGKLSNPFFTRFTPTDFVNFYGWADEQEIWQQPAYNDLFGMLFYNKLNPRLQQIYELRTYDRLQITGIVRSVFQDAPWIEVLDFKQVTGKLDTAVLTHLYRGEQLMEQRQWQRAIAELALAPGSEVPPAAQRKVHRNLGVCYLRIGEAAQAIDHLTAASNMSPETDLEMERLLAIAATQPALELDRTVDVKSLKDHERPMWEAFEDTRAAKLTGR